MSSTTCITNKEPLESTRRQINALQRQTPRLNAPLFTVREAEGAGYGVFASRSIAAHAGLLVSQSPAAYVIYRTFRKEVCAWCFRYERGRNWKVRFTSTTPDAPGYNGGGMVFCREECRQMWYDNYGPIALESYSALEGHIQRHARNQPWNSGGSGEESDREGDQAILQPEEVDKVWTIIERQAALIRSLRLRGPANSDSKAKLKTERKALSEALALPIVDSDLLFFLLSGVLCRFLSATVRTSPSSTANAWDTLLMLNPSKPYASLNALYLTVNAYLQLLAILPTPILHETFLSRETFEVVLSRDVGNSFGIWSTAGTTEDPEMLGYGIWPSASFFNHSCSPNVAKERQGRAWIFSAAPGEGSSIEAGAELCITYIRGEEDTLPIQERRKKLESGWGFICHCSKCLNEERARMLQH